MNKVIVNYILKKFLKTLLLVIAVFYCFGLILNLFEEIEFFKNLNVSLFLPLMLTSIFIPSMIVKLLPFIIFISSMIFMIKIRNNKDLLTLKVYGYSNIKIFFILALSSFIVGWFILFVTTPITSSLIKYYEKTKSIYAKDIDHLVTVNKNGLWIKESLQNQERIITASKPNSFELSNVTIFHLSKNYKLKEKIIAKSADISSNDWILKDVIVSSLDKGLFEYEKKDTYRINSIYDYEKINSLFKNFDTMSFLDLIVDYKVLLDNGYNEIFLKQSLHTMLSLPFFLFLMTAIASILTLNTLQRSDNLKFAAIGLIITVLVYYFKDLSLALGLTDRVPLILAIWSPVIALSLFTFIGVLQINEK
jgi:lipopolysaccharide export system permease protein